MALTKDGFAIRHEGLTGASATTTYMAPATVRIDTSVGVGNAEQTLELYVSPSRPGLRNHVGRMVIRLAGDDRKMPTLLKQFTLAHAQVDESPLGGRLSQTKCLMSASSGAYIGQKMSLYFRTDACG